MAWIVYIVTHLSIETTKTKKFIFNDFAGLGRKELFKPYFSMILLYIVEHNIRKHNTNYKILIYIIYTSLKYFSRRMFPR